MTETKTFQLGAMYWQNPNFGQKEVEEDMRRIKNNNFNIIRAFIWWEEIERKKGEFNFAMHDILFEAAAKHNIRVMETFGLYLPGWLKKELAIKGIDDSDRRYACFDRPEVMEPMQNYIQKVVERYKDAQSLAIWNLWNEPTKSPCKCVHTLKKFVDWLKERYKNTTALRNAWLGEHQVFDTYCPDNIDEINVPWLQDAFRFAIRGRATPMEYDFIEFSTHNLNDNLEWISSIVREIDPLHEHHANPCSPIANGCNRGLDEWKMAKKLDSISVSVHASHFFFAVEEPENFPSAYSFSTEEIRCWADGKNAWIGELQAGTTCHHLFKYTPDAKDIYHYIWQAVGRGLDGLLFWEWQGWRSSMMEAGEFSLRRPHDGGPTERSEAAAKVGGILKKNEAFFSQLKRPASQVAIMISMKSKILKYLQACSRAQCQDIETDHSYAVYACFKAFERANIAVDFVTEDRILDGKLPNYKVVFLPHVEVIGQDVAAKLKEYVNGGGRLWADGRCGFLDEHVFIRAKSPGHGMDEIFGCREADFVAVRKNAELEMNSGEKLNPYLFAQYLELTVGEARGFCNGHPIVVRNNYGKGLAELCGTYFALGLQINRDEKAMDYLVSFAKEAGVIPRLELTPEYGFEACMLNSPEGDFIAATNRSGQEMELKISPPSKYTEVICPQDDEITKTSWDSKSIKRSFKDFETAVFICRK